MLEHDQFGQPYDDTGAPIPFRELGPVGTSGRIRFVPDSPQGAALLFGNPVLAVWQYIGLRHLYSKAGLTVGAAGDVASIDLTGDSVLPNRTLAYEIVISKDNDVQVLRGRLTAFAKNSSGTVSGETLTQNAESFEGVGSASSAWSITPATNSVVIGCTVTSSLSGGYVTISFGLAGVVTIL